MRQSVGRRAQAQLLQLARGLFGSPGNLAITLICALALAWIAPALLRWAVTEAAWSGSPESCRIATGACWLFIREKLDFIVFGLFPQEERWRAIISMALVVALFGAALWRALWGWRLALLWPVVLALAMWLLLGGFGLAPVRSELIGGVPLSLLLPVTALSLGFPLAVLLALGRRSRLWLLRAAATGFVELFRSAPFISILFMASVMLPFFVPEAWAPPKLVRACVAFTFVAAAYMAESVRGGLQAVPDSQVEAANALGLRGWQVVVLVSLPQAIRHAIPGLCNVVVLFLMATSLLSVIGMSDFLAVIQLGTRDPAWAGFEVEGYVFAAAAYFLVCATFNSYARELERRVG